MSDIAFADSARPTRPVILNLLMQPYSFGHEVLLLQQRNALLFPDFEKLGPGEQIKAIGQAVLICCQDWNRNNCSHRWLWLWRWANRKADFGQAIIDFHTYRAAGSTFPRITPPEKGRSLGSGHLTRVFNFAYPRFGESAYDKPLGFLQFLYFSHAESEGNCAVENQDEMEIRLQIEKYQAEYEKEQEAKCQV